MIFKSLNVYLFMQTICNAVLEIARHGVAYLECEFKASLIYKAKLSLKSSKRKTEMTDKQKGLQYC